MFIKLDVVFSFALFLMKQAPSVFPIAQNLGIPTSPNFNIMHTIYGQTTNFLAGYALKANLRER
jgi:hypothetical protein